jgi:hypothetical protein
MTEKKNEMRGEEWRGFDCGVFVFGGRKRGHNAAVAEGREERRRTDKNGPPRLPGPTIARGISGRWRR